MIYLKYLEKNKYCDCSFNEDGNLYIIYKVKVQRGMGNQKANEVIIYGMNEKFIDEFLIKERAVIVSRENPINEDDYLILEGKEEINVNK